MTAPGGGRPAGVIYLDKLSRGDATSGHVPKLLRLSERLKLLEGLVLNLTNPLAGDVERPPDLVERPRMLAAQPIPQLENLSYRERRVLELRYGLGGEHPRTLDEVGRTFNVTRERIRQIENQSLKKLQSLAEAQKLRDVA